MATAQQLIDQLSLRAEPEYKQKQAGFGIPTDRALGVRMPAIREIAKSHKKDHDLAISLWETEILEARLLAGMIADPKRMDAALANYWVAEIDAWPLCEVLCDSLVKTDFWESLIVPWARDEREYVRRCGYVLLITASMKHKKLPDEYFLKYLPLLEENATDPRNFPKKAINWAIRELGKKRNELYAPCLELAEKLAVSDDKTARWIGKDAVRELRAKGPKE